MEIKDFPHCCTARIVVNFGESDVAEGGDQAIDEQELDQYLADREHTYRAFGMAMLVATTNDQQTTANKVFLRRGYKHSKWMSKSTHPETKVRLWYLPLRG